MQGSIVSSNVVSILTKVVSIHIFLERMHDRNTLERSAIAA